jgi:RNA polymerase sigma-70 factor (ECF subfamily)
MCRNGRARYGPRPLTRYHARVSPPEEPVDAADSEVARRIAARGEDAAAHEAELCRRFLNRARLYGLKHLRFDVTAAEDLAQQVMIAVLEALRAGRVEDLTRIDRFMLGTCRNVAHSMRRAQKRRAETRQRLSAELGSVVTPPWELVPTRRVEDCLGALAPRETRVLQLLFQEGSTATETAGQLGTTAGNVRVIRHRAMARLRECVDAGPGEASS